jgi:hypothetical protein
MIKTIQGNIVTLGATSSTPLFTSPNLVLLHFKCSKVLHFTHHCSKVWMHTYTMYMHK